MLYLNKLVKFFTLKSIMALLLSCFVSAVIKTFITCYYDPNLKEFFGLLVTFFPTAMGGRLAYLISNNILFMDNPNNMPASSGSTENVEGSGSANTAVKPEESTVGSATRDPSIKSETIDRKGPATRDPSVRSETENDTSSSIWSDAGPLEPWKLRTEANSLAKEFGSFEPIHKVPDPLRTGKKGYNPYDTGSLQPYAPNLANYLEASKNGPQAHIRSSDGIPKMDHDSIKFICCYMNYKFPTYYLTENFSPTSGIVLYTLRREN